MTAVQATAGISKAAEHLPLFEIAPGARWSRSCCQQNRKRKTPSCERLQCFAYPVALLIAFRSAYHSRPNGSTSEFSRHLRHYYGELLCDVLPCSFYEENGGGEIRTHEAFRPSGFQDRRDQPLCHPSGELVITDQQSVGNYSRN